jgi:hypothetical protein
MEPELLNTKEFAEIFRVKTETVRHGLCLDGHYLGLKPLKLQNGRLLWSKTAALQMVAIDQTVSADRRENPVQTRQR